MASTSKPIRQKLKEGANRSKIAPKGYEKIHSPTGKQKQLRRVEKKIQQLSSRARPKSASLLRGTKEGMESYAAERKKRDANLISKIPKSYKEQRIKHTRNLHA